MIIDMGKNAQKETFVPIELKPCPIKAQIEEWDLKLSAAFLPKGADYKWAIVGDSRVRTCCPGRLDSGTDRRLLGV